MSNTLTFLGQTHPVSGEIVKSKPQRLGNGQFGFVRYFSARDMHSSDVRYTPKSVHQARIDQSDR